MSYVLMRRILVIVAVTIACGVFGHHVGNEIIDAQHHAERAFDERQAAAIEARAATRLYEAEQESARNREMLEQIRQLQTQPQQ